MVQKRNNLNPNKKSTRLVINLLWFSIGCPPAGYLNQLGLNKSGGKDYE